MKFEVERQPLSDLIGEDRELVVYDRHGSELRTLKGVIIRGGQGAGSDRGAAQSR